MQNHRVRLIGQEELPRGKEWALVECDERMTLFIAEGSLRTDVLEEAWAAYRLLMAPAPPRPRLGSPLLRVS